MMRNVSLRVQVFIIVTILAIGLVGAMIYVTATIGRTRESIIRFDRERLSALTDDLSRRYGSVMNFVAPSQAGDTALSERAEITKLLVNITRERLQNLPPGDLRQHMAIRGHLHIGQHRRPELSPAHRPAPAS